MRVRRAILWITRHTMTVRRKSLWTTITLRGQENDIHEWNEVVLTCHYRNKNLHSLLRTDGKTKRDKLVTRRVDGGNIGIARKVVWNKNNWIEETHWSDTKSILISIDTYHRRKTAPLIHGCVLVLQCQSGLTNLALKGPNGELSWHSPIFSDSLSQLQWKCLPLQTLLQGP